ncbi:unnamed protein product [Alternaria alternata]
MSTVENVVLLGKGLLGSSVLPALVDAGFKVTLLGRSVNKKDGLPAGVKFAVVDYNSIDSLEAAFRGQQTCQQSSQLDRYQAGASSWLINQAKLE